jgi:dolichol-phosphate mannosyltransferase
METKNELSVVIPVYNSANIFPELHRRLTIALQPIVQDFEVIAVLDGCSDNSFDVIAKYCEVDKRIKLLELSRNFGHQAAITAGMQTATGELVIIMDDDLEDPPEILPQFLSKIKEGFDVVYGVRRKRKRSLFINAMYKSYYRLLSRLVDVKMPYDAGDFCIMKRKIVNILNDMPERNMYLRGLRAWSGFRQTGLEYDREDRFANRPGYNLRKYFALAFDAIFSFSYKPLRYVFGLGLAIASISFMLAIIITILKIFNSIRDVPGWTSLLLAVLCLAGVQLISIGIIGEYVLRIYDEVKQRPKYIIGKSIGVAEVNKNGL